MAQLLTLIDNKGNVVACEIVPNGSHEHVISCIKKVLQSQTSNCVTKCFYSDKAVADKNLGSIFQTFYKQNFNLDCSVEILQGL